METNGELVFKLITWSAWIILSDSIYKDFFQHFTTKRKFRNERRITGIKREFDTLFLCSFRLLHLFLNLKLTLCYFGFAPQKYMSQIPLSCIWMAFGYGLIFVWKYLVCSWKSFWSPNFSSGAGQIGHWKYFPSLCNFAMCLFNNFFLKNPALHSLQGWVGLLPSCLSLICFLSLYTFKNFSEHKWHTCFIFWSFFGLCFSFMCFSRKRLAVYLFLQNSQLYGFAGLIFLIYFPFVDFTSG